MNSIDNIQVSVIVPVYNSAEYLHESIGSILADKANNFELILVDDGSSDDSGSICDAIALEDERVVVVHKENGGMCAARNDAMRIARGKYVTFADNDDEVLPGFIQDNLNLAVKYDADCVRFGRRVQRYNDKGEVDRNTDAVPSHEYVVEGDAIRRDWLKNWYGTDGVWAGMYRLGMLREHNITFPEEFRKGWEDCYFNDLVIDAADSIVFSPNVYYIWKQRAVHSSSMTIAENTFVAIRKLLELEQRMILDYDIAYSDPRAGADRFFSRVRSCLVLPARSGFKRSDQFEVYRRVRSMLLPYSGTAWSCPGGSTDKVMYSLLMAEHYTSLSLFIGAGLRVKSLIAR